ncbi:DUF484 family protein [Magnetofaba australis]|nr:DUF484 family protein [Magnetofaba australis]
MNDLAPIPMENADRIDEEVVRNWLLANPGFFRNNSDLLPEAIHASGKVLNLEAGHLNQLRRENARIREDVEQMLERIRRNEAIHHTFHALQKRLIQSLDENCPGRLLQRAVEGLESSFGLRRVSVTLSDRSDGLAPGGDLSAFVAEGEGFACRLNTLPHEQLMTTFSRGVEPVVRVGQEALDREAFFGQCAREVRSDVIIPLYADPLAAIECAPGAPLAEPIGSLNLGGSEPNRFLPSYSTDLVRDMADIFCLLLLRAMESKQSEANQA